MKILLLLIAVLPSIAFGQTKSTKNVNAAPNYGKQNIGDQYNQTINQHITIGTYIASQTVITSKPSARHIDSADLSRIFATVSNGVPITLWFCTYTKESEEYGWQLVRGLRHFNYSVIVNAFGMINRQRDTDQERFEIDLSNVAAPTIWVYQQ